MKRVLYIHFFLILALVLSGAQCNRKLASLSEESDTEETTFEDLLMFGWMAGHDDWASVRICAQHRHPNPAKHQFDLGGQVRNGHPFAHLIDGGQLFLNEIELSSREEEMPGIYGPRPNSWKNESIARPFFGNHAIFQLTGNPANHIPLFMEEMYVPQLMEAVLKIDGKTIEDSIQYFHYDSNIEINWEPDTLAPHEALVWVSFPEPMDYELTESHAYYQERKLIGKIFRQMRVPDNGHIRLNMREWIKKIPWESDFEIGIARGNKKAISRTDKTFRIYSRSTSEFRFILKP